MREPVSDSGDSEKPGSQKIVDGFLLQQGLPYADVLSSEKINRIFRKHGGLFGKDGIFSTAVVLWAFPGQVQRDRKEASCQAAVAGIISFCLQVGRDAPTADTGDYCRARAKLSEPALRELSTEIANDAEQQADEAWQWKGRHAKLADGFTFTMPDTKKNQAEFPHPRTQKKGVGLPIARSVVILSLATAILMDVVLGPYKGKETGELALLRQMSASLVRGAICVSNDAAVALNDPQWTMVKSWSDDTTPVSKEQFLDEVYRDVKISDANREAIKSLLAKPLPRVDLKHRLLAPPSGMPGYVASILSALAFLLATVKLQESRRPSEQSQRSSHRAFRPDEAIRHLSTPGMSIILFAVFITTFGFAQFESTLSLLTSEFGYSTQWNFLLYAYVGLVLSIGQGMLVRRLLPRLGERRMALIGVTLMTIGFSLIGLTGLKILPGMALWFILPVVVIGFSAVTPSLQSMLSQAASSDEQGSVLGTGQSLSSLARILGPSLGIPLLRQSTALPYFLGAALILSGGALILRMPGRRAAKQPG